MQLLRLAAVLLLSFATAAHADNEPVADWTPDPDSNSPEGVDNPGAVPSADATPEITVSGASFAVTATPTIGEPGNVANVACSILPQSGTPGALTLSTPTNFSMAKLSDTPPTWSPTATITINCVHDAAPITGLLICNQTPKIGPTGRMIKTWWDVSCPPVGAPEWSSAPNNGTAINLSTTVGTPTTSTVTVTNTGASNLTVNPTGLSGALSITGSGATATIAPGANQGFTITCNPGSASTSNQTLSFDTNDATGGEDPVTFPVQCVGTAAAAPEYNSTPANGATISITSAIGTPATSTLNISNTGSAALTGTISGLSGVMSIAPPGLNLAAGANQNYTITCTPAAATTVVQTLTVTSNDADEATNTYTVQCTGSSAPAPEFSSTPVGGSTLSITTTVGTPQTATVNVSNPGNATLNVSASIGGGPVFTVAPAASQAIAPAGNRTFTVTCNPSTPGVQTQTLALATNDSDESNVTYTVQCTAQAPEFDSSPAAPGPIALTGTQGGPTATANLTVSNTGTAPMTLAAGGLGGRFSVVGVSSPIAPGGNVVLTVRCTTGNPPGTYTDTLVLTTNDADEGTVNYNVTCEIGDSSAADFFSNPSPGPITINTAPNVAGTASIFVQNVGGAAAPALTITSATFTPTAPTTTEITVTPPAPGSLAGGASQTFTVSCTSATPGTYTGTYSIVHSDAGESPANYPITCNVANAPPDYGSSPSPGATIAISAVVGSTQTGTVTARNVGGGTLNVSAAIPGGPVFGVAPAGPTPIAGGGSQALTASCTPASTTTQSQTLTVTTDESGTNTYTYTVTCTGLAPSGGEFDPSIPNGGTITINTTRGNPAPPRVLTITNSGATNLTLSGVALTTGTVVTFAAPAPTPPITINPSLTRNINLTCQSATPGVFNDTLTFTTSDVDEGTVTYSITCVVADIPPDINTLQNPGTPITINALFGSPATTTITVQNTAAATGGTLNVTSGGLFSPLSVTAPAGGGAAIAPGNQTNFTIQCFPTVVFVNGFPVFQIGTFQQQLVFTSDDPDENPVVFNVTCISGFAPQAEYSSAPDAGQTITLNTLPNAAVTAPLRVSNSGSIPDTATPSIAGSATIAVAPAAATPIAPGAFQDFVITCTPTAIGTTTATLTVGSTDPDELTNTYNVVCNAGAPPEPEVVSFPTSGFPIALTGLSGSQVSTNVGFTNVGNFTLRILSCQTSGQTFSVGPSPTFPLDIAPADSAVVTVVCRVPPVGVPATGRLNCQTSDSDEPDIFFPLSCSGTTLPPTTVPGPGAPLLALLALALLMLGGKVLARRGFAA